MADNPRTGQSRRSNIPDLLLWGSGGSIFVLYVHAILAPPDLVPIDWVSTLSAAVFELMNTIWWGIVIGIVMVSILTKVPREFVIGALGRGGSLGGVLRATLGGVLLDLCSHGILMVGAKLYERGASAGQLTAFLVASPWNSFSLTLVLIALIGLKWTLGFIALSLIIAVIAGMIFDRLVSRGLLPANPHSVDLPDDFKLWPAIREEASRTNFGASFFSSMLADGLQESRMVLRWILFGVLLAAFVKTFMDTDNLKHFFGPTMGGLLLTMVVATILEVCSEGSTPVAAGLLTRAGAPGNSFAFLMTGVATDYTEIMILKEASRSWQFAFFCRSPPFHRSSSSRYC